MKELRETMGVFAIVALMPCLFLLISILIAMIYITNPIQDAYLFKFLLVDVSITALSAFLIWILNDEVWDRRNMPDEQRKRLYRLK